MRFVPLEALMPLILEQLEAGKNVRFSPRGISMLPMLRQGVDSVVLSPLPSRLKKYDLPLYRRKSGQYVLHRVVEAGIPTLVLVTTSLSWSRAWSTAR